MHSWYRKLSFSGIFLFILTYRVSVSIFIHFFSEPTIAFTNFTLSANFLFYWVFSLLSPHYASFEIKLLFFAWVPKVGTCIISIKFFFFYNSHLYYTFPSRTTLDGSYKFWYIVLLFSFTKHFLIELVFYLSSMCNLNLLFNFKIVGDGPDIFLSMTSYSVWLRLVYHWAALRRPTRAVLVQPQNQSKSPESATDMWIV